MSWLVVFDDEEDTSAGRIVHSSCLFGENVAPDFGRASLGEWPPIEHPRWTADVLDLPVVAEPGWGR